MNSKTEFGQPIFFIDSDFYVEKLSRTLIRKMQIGDETAALGEKCHRLFFNRAQPCHNCPVFRALAFKTIVANDIKLDPREDFAFSRHASATPIHDENGNVHRLIIDCLGADYGLYMSHEKLSGEPRFDEKSDYKKNGLEKRHILAQIKMLSFFASRMAHDIKNVLALISTNVDFITSDAPKLGQPKDSDKIVEYAEKIQQHVQHIVEIVDLANSLKVHNWETTADCDLANMLNRVVTVTQLSKPSAKFDFKITIDPRLPLITTSEIYLERALTELLRSMLANSGENGTMSISLEYAGQKEDYFVITIQCRQQLDLFHDVGTLLFQFYTMKNEWDPTKIGVLIAYATILIHDGSVESRFLENGEYQLVVKLPRAAQFSKTAAMVSSA